MPVIDAYNAPASYNFSLMFAISGKALNTGSSKSLIRLSFHAWMGLSMTDAQLGASGESLIFLNASAVLTWMPGQTSTIVLEDNVQAMGCMISPLPLA